MKLWQKLALTVGGVGLLELGARIALPGINAAAVRDYFANGGTTFLLSLYERIGGGGLSRGGIIALGVMPYLAARVYIRLYRIVSPRAEAMTQTSVGRKTLTRWTRGLTVALSVIQSLGLASFLESIPGAVVNPGIGFLAQTVFVLTAGSIVTMAISERLTTPDERGDSPQDSPKQLSPSDSLGNDLNERLRRSKAESGTTV